MHQKHEIVGELEHLTTTKKQLHGGSHEDTTLHDLGFEKTLNDEVRPVRKKRPQITEQQVIDGQGLGGLMAGCGMSAGGLSAGGISAGGFSAGSKPKKQERRKKPLLLQHQLKHHQMITQMKYNLMRSVRVYPQEQILKKQENQEQRKLVVIWRMF